MAAKASASMLKAMIGLTMLAAEAQQVIWLRCFKLAAGGAAARAEARRMGSEKVVAATQAVGAIMAGETPPRIVTRYRKRVRANRRRLSRLR
jgi:hypothetical protein